jgi:hypothetical protein
MTRSAISDLAIFHDALIFRHFAMSLEIYQSATKLLNPAPLPCASEHDYVTFANGFAISRAVSMNSWAIGLSVRFFSVTMPAGPG